MLEKIKYLNIEEHIEFLDVGGGLAGAGAGFKRGLSQAPALRSPFLAGANVVGQTMAGGFIGTFLGGAVPRTARQLAINNFYENSYF
jgi:hypothetical protein